MVPSATITIKLMTVFIGICTAWSSPIFSAINYLLNLDTIQFQTALILSQTLQQIFLHFSIMFFLLNFVEELISIFCFPLTCVLYVPFRCLHFPIWHIIFNSKRRYIPNTSIVRLCCIVPIVQGYDVSAFMLVRYL